VIRSSNWSSVSSLAPGRPTMPWSTMPYLTSIGGRSGEWLTCCHHIPSRCWISPAGRRDLYGSHCHTCSSLPGHLEQEGNSQWEPEGDLPRPETMYLERNWSIDSPEFQGRWVEASPRRARECIQGSEGALAAEASTRFHFNNQGRTDRGHDRAFVLRPEDDLKDSLHR